MDSLLKLGDDNSFLIHIYNLSGLLKNCTSSYIFLDHSLCVMILGDLKLCSHEEKDLFFYESFAIHSTELTGDEHSIICPLYSHP